MALLRRRRATSCDLEARRNPIDPTLRSNASRPMAGAERVSANGAGERSALSPWQVSYHQRPVGEIASIMTITYLQQLSFTLRTLARAKLMGSGAVPSKHS